MTRAFVAVTLSDDTVDALHRLQSALPVGRLMDLETLHVTLAFLGDQPEETLEDLHDLLAGIRAAPFDITVADLGTFGATTARSLWAGIAPEPRLDALQTRILTAVRRVGVTLPARRFTPHVTLARFRPSETEDPRLSEYIAANAAFRLPPEPVSGFTLYASTLYPEGAQHDPLAQYSLV